MTSWCIVRIFAGSFILVSLDLGAPGSSVFVGQWWLAFTAFVGANLLQSAFTRHTTSGQSSMRAQYPS